MTTEERVAALEERCDQQQQLIARLTAAAIFHGWKLYEEDAEPKHGLPHKYTGPDARFPPTGLIDVPEAEPPNRHEIQEQKDGRPT